MRLSPALEAEFARVARAPVESLVGVLHPGEQPGLNAHIKLCRWRRVGQPVVSAEAYLRILDPDLAKGLGELARGGAVVSVEARLDDGPSPANGLWYGRLETFNGDAVDVDLATWAATLVVPVVRPHPTLGTLRLDRSSSSPQLVAVRRSSAGTFDLSIDADLDGGADLDDAAARVSAFEDLKERYRSAALGVCEGAWGGPLSGRWLPWRLWLRARVRLTGLFVRSGYLTAFYSDAGLFDGHHLSVGVGRDGQVLWAKNEG